MNEISMDTSSFNSSIIQTQSLFFSPDSIDPKYHLQLIDNQTLSLLTFHNPWIFPIFILALLGILLTIIILFIFLYLSVRRLNNHLVLTNVFICFSIGFIYIIVIFFLIRGNELLCSLREFLSQLAYALLFSALLCRYIMQWLAARILSNRTKQMTALLIYMLLVCTQIPIGILWWYFTSPRACAEETMDEYPKWRMLFQKRTSASKACAHQCTVDYRSYATYTYTILELLLCTIIAMCLFLCRHCHRSEIQKEQSRRIYKNHTSLTCFNMFAFVLIDIAWLLWTFIYHYTHSLFAFPALVIGMFTIGTICLLFILVPQVYFYSKVKLNDVNYPRTTLYSNRLTATDDAKDQDLLLHEKGKDRLDASKQRTFTNDSELSYEIGTSGTFLPITRTPRGPFKVRTTEKVAPAEIIDVLIDNEYSNSSRKSSHPYDLTHSEMKINKTVHQPDKHLQVPSMPLKRQSTSSDASSTLLNLPARGDYLYRYHSNVRPPSTSSMYYSSYVPSNPDETIIPILCSPPSHRTTPVKMRILVKSPPLSHPRTRRIYSGTDHRYAQYPYPHVFPSSLPLPPATPTFYSSPSQEPYLIVDPYRLPPSYSGSHMWHSNTPSSYRQPYGYRRYPLDHRSLAQRLWDIDSGDDEDDMEGNMLPRYSRITPTNERWKDCRSSQTENDDQTILHMDADEEEESYNKKRLYA